MPEKKGATVIVGPEARGFIFGCPVANNMGIGFVPVRKPGKLPREALTASYDFWYGYASLTIQRFYHGAKVITMISFCNWRNIVVTASLQEKHNATAIWHWLN